MHLQALLDDVEVRALIGELVEVQGITHDSRAAGPGVLFCCVPGSVTDGHRFAADAVAAGATALIVDRKLDLEVSQVVVDDVRSAMGRAAAAFHGHPSRAMDVVGVTGTNGKTTTAWLLRAILDRAGRPTGLIGTLTGERTTPESTELQAQLADMRNAGVVAVAMEVSSIALDLSRVEGTRFRVAVFTNLSRDHLDFHPSMEAYFAAKAKLFEPDRSETAVVNADDPRGRLLIDAAQIPTSSYSLEQLENLDVGPVCSSATWRGRRLYVPLGGSFNMANALAAASVALELGLSEDEIVDGLAAAPPVPGRFEAVDAGQPFTVVVDDAHTPDALENVLRAARTATSGRLLLVFGCGGDRDPGKRPMMGEVASRIADLTVITSDNPRGEEPDAIIEAVREGVDGDATIVVEPDRRRAIEVALARAQPGDLVLIAGKGHETTQVIGDRTLPFDDRVVARELLEARVTGSGSQ